MMTFFEGVLEISLGMSVLIVLLLLLLRLVGAKFTAKCRYIIWILVLIRLAIPFSGGILPALVYLPVESHTETFLSAQTGEETESANAATGYTQPSHPISDLSYPREEVPAPPENAPQATSEPLTNELLLKCVSGVYFAVAGAFLLCSLISYIVYTGKVLKSAREADSRMKKIYAPICLKKGLHRPPVLLVSPCINSPAAFGIFRRRIVLPDIEFDDNGLTGTLAHEVTHCRRGDLYVKLIALLARSLHWFNPLVHLAAFRCEMEMELSCDEAVLAGCGDDVRAAYGAVMLDIIKRCRQNRTTLTTHFNPKKNAVRARITNILYGSGKRRGRLLIAVCLALCVFAGTFIACRVTGEKKIDAMISVEIESSVPEEILDWAKENVAERIEIYNRRGSEGDSALYSGPFTIIKAKITALEKVGAGAAGVNGFVELYRLEYRLLPDEPDNVMFVVGEHMEDGWITEWESVGQPYLLLFRDRDGEVCERICITNTDEITHSWGTDEMLGKYGNKYNAAAVGLYNLSHGDNTADIPAGIELVTFPYTEKVFPRPVHWENEKLGIVEIETNTTPAFAFRLFEWISHTENIGNESGWNFAGLVWTLSAYTQEEFAKTAEHFMTAESIDVYSEIFSSSSFLVGTDSEYAYVLSLPTDVQYIENDPVSRSQYEQLQVESQAVIRDFMAVNGITPNPSCPVSAVYSPVSDTVSHEEIVSVKSLDELSEYRERHIISDRLYEFYFNLLSGQSEIPEYNTVKISNFTVSFTVPVTDSTTYLAFNVSESGLDTIPTGKYDWIIRELRDVSIENRSAEASEFADIPEVKKLYAFLRGSYIYNTPVYGMGVEYPGIHNYICDYYGDGSTISYDEYCRVAADEFGVTDFDSLLPNPKDLMYEDGKVYAGGIGGGWFGEAVDVSEGESIVTVVMQYYADCNRLLKSHKIAYYFGRNGVQDGRWLGFEILAKSSYEPYGLTYIADNGVNHSVTEIYQSFLDTAVKPYEEYIAATEYLDLDANGTPELLIYDWGAGANCGAEIFTIENGQVRSFYTGTNALTHYGDDAKALAEHSSHAVDFTFWAQPSPQSDEDRGKCLWFVPCTDSVTGKSGHLLYSYNGSEIHRSEEYYFFCTGNDGYLSVILLFALDKKAVDSNPSLGWTYFIHGEPASAERYIDVTHTAWLSIEERFGVQYSEANTFSVLDEP